MQQALAATAKEKAPEQVPANKHDNNKKRKKQQNVKVVPRNSHQQEN
jgi:hypothetical protein